MKKAWVYKQTREYFECPECGIENEIINKDDNIVICHNCMNKFKIAKYPCENGEGLNEIDSN